MSTAEMTRDDVMRETASHIRRVGNLMAEMMAELMHRAVNHDQSKWSDDEWVSFARETPGLRGLTYGSPEYKDALLRLGPALQLHYRRNTNHHPDVLPNGVNDMTLLDLLEMICDWKAATERHADGDIASSITKNAERFGLSPQLVAILTNTVRSVGWTPPVAGAPIRGGGW